MKHLNIYFYHYWHHHFNNFREGFYIICNLAWYFSLKVTKFNFDGLFRACSILITISSLFFRSLRLNRANESIKDDYNSTCPNLVLKLECNSYLELRQCSRGWIFLYSFKSLLKYNCLEKSSFSLILSHFVNTIYQDSATFFYLDI
jgi:hypothetical protein